MGLHRLDVNINKELERLERSNVCGRNKELIKEFYVKLLAEGLSKARIYKYLMTLRVISQKYNKPFDIWSEKDIINVLAFIENNGWKRETVNDYKKTLKKFFSWLNGRDWKPLENVKMRKERNRKPDFLNEDEILKMIEVVGHPRDKALIAVGYEGGLRIGELAGLKVKDVEFLSIAGDLKAKIRVSGKTGERRIPLIMSVKYLREWLDVHPDKDNPEAFVFCSISNRKYGEPMEYQSFNKIIRMAAKRAGIRKRVYPHILRHSRATVLAKYLTESLLCEYFGWVQGSDVPRVYVHLSGRDLDEAIDGLYGVRKEEKPKIAKPKRCPRCDYVNVPTAKYCSNCALILDEGERLRIEMEESKIAKDLMDIVMRNPEMLAQIKEMIEFVERLREDPELMQMMMRLRDESIQQVENKSSS